jgi:serine protease Do
MRYAVILFVCLLSACRPAESNGTLPDFTALVEKNAPAVVNISTSIDPGKAQQNMQQQVPDFLKRFFEGLEQGQGPDMAPQPAESSGSGFIIGDDGYILTNRHVVAGADHIIVRLSDRRELEAELVGQDERSDIALLKVEASGLPTLTVGSSEQLKVGEWVLAIGAPFGFDSSVTAGIVSAKGRSLPSENYVPFIQTDVAINPGNSGGPLFNLDGEVVGINSQIISRNGGYMGLSFAIPIDIAMDVVAQLKDKGRVSRGWLGVMIQPVDRDLAASFGLDKPTGALVSRVLPGSPAETAGVQAGDVILSFNGEEIEESSELPQVVGLLSSGTKAQAKVMRDGERTTLTIEIGDLPDDAEARFGGAAPSNERADTGALGLTVAPLTPQDRQQRDVDGGVLVKKVADGPAQEAGIRAGDVILSLNNRPTDTPEAFAEQVKTLPKAGAVAVLVFRDGDSRFVAVKLGSDAETP